MQFFPYSGLYLSTFASVRATIFVYLANEKFLFPATFFRITILIFQNDKFPFLYLGLNSRLKVAGALLRCLVFVSRSPKQKLIQIGRIPFCLFLNAYSNNPPNLVA